MKLFEGDTTGSLLQMLRPGSKKNFSYNHKRKYTNTQFSNSTRTKT